MAGMAAGARDDLDQAVELYEESARLAREHGDTGIVTIAVNNLGTIAASRGDYERALELFEEALRSTARAPIATSLRSRS